MMAGTVLRALIVYIKQIYCLGSYTIVLATITASVMGSGSIWPGFFSVRADAVPVGQDVGYGFVRLELAYYLPRALGVIALRALLDGSLFRSEPSSSTANIHPMVSDPSTAAAFFLVALFAWSLTFLLLWVFPAALPLCVAEQPYTAVEPNLPKKMTSIWALAFQMQALWVAVRDQPAVFFVPIAVYFLFNSMHEMLDLYPIYLVRVGWTSSHASAYVAVAAVAAPAFLATASLVVQCLGSHRALVLYCILGGIGSLMLVVGSVLLVTPLVWISAVMEPLGDVSFPLTRAICVGLVPSSVTGTTLILFGFLNNVSDWFGGYMLPTIFVWTSSSVPNAVAFFVSAMRLGGAILAMWALAPMASSTRMARRSAESRSWLM